MSESHREKKVRTKGTDSTPPTTAFLYNPCKFRGKTIDILGILSNSGGLTTREIADRTAMSIKVLNVILPRGEKKGIFERKERWGWKASPFGFLILNINNNNANANTTTTQHKYNTNTTRTLDSSRKSHQLNLSVFTNRSDINEPERVVVGVLVQHYERTGQKFRYFRDFYHFCDETSVGAVDAPAAIARLKEEGCIYTRKDEFGWKIGLKADFVERLKIC